MKGTKMLNKLIATFKNDVLVQPMHIALATEKMEQTMSRLATSKNIALFQTDYLE